MIIEPVEHISGTITAPASKSYAQRAIAIASLCNNTSILKNITLCNDISVALDIIKQMGAEVAVLDNGDYSIKGGINPKNNLSLNVGEAGLSTRLFSPLVSLFNCKTHINGEGSILNRHLGNIEDPIRQLGAKIKTQNGYLPIDIQGAMTGGTANIDGSVGSQLLTGLLIALPKAKNDTLLKVSNLKSIPYIDITLEVIKKFGGKIINEDYKTFFIDGGQNYKAKEYNIEGDWSGASCLLVAGALCGHSKKGLKITNLDIQSPQADKAIIEALKYSGVEISLEKNCITTFKSNIKSFNFDATHCPDLFPALVALASVAKGESIITGTNRLTHKESNRAIVLKEAYSKMGIEIDISEENIMRIKGGRIKGGVTIDSYNDHRIAMSIATVALIADAPISITHPEAVNKSYSDFWNALKSIKH